MITHRFYIQKMSSSSLVHGGKTRSFGPFAISLDATARLPSVPTAISLPDPDSARFFRLVINRGCVAHGFRVIAPADPPETPIDIVLEKFAELGPDMVIDLSWFGQREWFVTADDSPESLRVSVGELSSVTGGARLCAGDTVTRGTTVFGPDAKASVHRPSSAAIDAVLELCPDDTRLMTCLGLWRRAMFEDARMLAFSGDSGVELERLLAKQAELNEHLELVALLAAAPHVESALVLGSDAWVALCTGMARKTTERGQLIGVDCGSRELVKEASGLAEKRGVQSVVHTKLPKEDFRVDLLVTDNATSDVLGELLERANHYAMFCKTNDGFETKI